MEQNLSFKIQSVIDKLHSVLDNQEKLETGEEVSGRWELYDEEHAKSPFLEFSLGEDLYAILNAKEEYFYTVERTYSQGEKTEREVDDETINELLSEIFRNGDYVINTYYRVYDGGGSVLDPYSAQHHYETGEVSGVPLTTVGYKSKSDVMTPYQVIAKNALMNWNGLSEEEATKKVRESTFEELEAQVYAEGSITYALEGLQIASKKAYDKLRRNGMNSEPIISDWIIKELKEIVLHGGDKKYEDAIYDKVKEGLMLKNMPYIWTKKQLMLEDIPHILTGEDMVLTVLSHIHDGWVKDNQKKFMSRDKKYQHMPFELIGWQEAKSDLLFLNPILQAMGIDIPEEDLEKAYDDRVKDFFKSKGITSLDELSEQISRGAEFYPPLKGQEDILQTLQNPEFVSETLIPSIKEKGIGADESAMKRVEQWKNRSSRLATARARKQELEEEAKLIAETEKLINEKENSRKGEINE